MFMCLSVSFSRHLTCFYISALMSVVLRTMDFITYFYNIFFSGVSTPSTRILELNEGNAHTQGKALGERKQGVGSGRKMAG